MAGGLSEPTAGCTSCIPQTNQNVHGFDRKIFENNVVSSRIKSILVGGCFYVCGAVALGNVIRGNLLSSVVPAVLAVACAYFRSNQSYELAKKAYDAMAIGDQKRAIAHIQQGANVNENLFLSPTILPFFSLAPVHLGYNHGPPSLLEQAARNECREVIKCLAQTKCDFNSSASILGHAQSLETVQLLIAGGSIVNLYNGLQYSPLYIQIIELSNILSLDKLEKKCEIIEYLLENGAKLQCDSAHEKRFKEVSKSNSYLNTLLARIESIPEATQLIIRLKDIAEKIR